MATSLVERCRAELEKTRDEMNGHLGGIDRVLSTGDVDDETRALLGEQRVRHQTRIGVIEAAVAALTTLMGDGYPDMPVDHAKELHTRLSKMLNDKEKAMNEATDEELRKLEQAMKPFEGAQAQTAKDAPKPKAKDDDDKDA